MIAFILFIAILIGLFTATIPTLAIIGGIWILAVIYNFLCGEY